MKATMTAGLLALATCGACRADVVYDFKIVDPTNAITVSGTLTTGAADSGGFDVTAITGTVSEPYGYRTAITGLDALYSGSDNILYPTSDPIVDISGISFDTADGNQFNINYYNGLSLLNRRTTLGLDVTFTVTLRAAQVPEPSSLGLAAAGMAAAGLFRWARRGHR